jgi:hypothetical protein
VYIFTILKYSINMQHKIYLLLAIMLISITATQAQTNVGVNTNTPDASAALDVTSTTQGMLVPRMTATQRGLISSPATGLLVYQTDAPAGFYFYNGTAWTTLSSGGSGDNLGNHTATQDLNMGGNSITGANNITATGTATLGGNAYPTTTGTNGQVLKTNGAGTLSWGSSGGNSFEVYATVTTAYTTSLGSSLSLPDAIVFSSNTSPAALTGGNIWQSSVADPAYSASIGATFSKSLNASKFTATTAGLYFVDVQITTAVVQGLPMLDYNGTGNSGSSYYGLGVANSLTSQAPHKGRGTLQRLVYMNAGDYFFIRLTSGAPAGGADIQTDGSSYIKIVKLL